MAFKVTAGYVTVTTAVEGGGRASVDIPRGAALPDDVPAEQREALLVRGDIEETAADEVPAEAGEQTDEVPDGTIAVILDWVDGDVARARRALHAEQLKGDKARMS